MSNQIDIAIDTLAKQYTKLSYSIRRHKNITEPIFEMPIPVLPHKRGDIVLSSHRQISEPEPYHRHDYFLINYSYSGDYIEHIEGNNITLHQGEVYLSQPYIAHSLLAHSQAQDSIISIRARKELVFHSLLPLMPKNEIFLDFFLSPLGASPLDEHKYMILSGDNTLNATIHSIFQTIIMEYVDMKPGYDTILDSALVMLFSLLSRCYYINRPTNSNQKSESLVDEILNYIGRTCATVTLKETANKFNYNPNYLSTILQKETGKTFSTLVREWRLKRACTLLQYSMLPVEEIGVLVGYPHSSNFYKTFKREYHVSPNQYRLNSKENS